MSVPSTLNNEQYGLIQDYYSTILLCRPTSIIDFSQYYFNADLDEKLNPRLSHALHCLRYLVGNTNEFHNYASILFCDELQKHGDPEADSISINTLVKLLKRLIYYEIKRSTLSPHPLQKSMKLIETFVMDQVPTEGGIINFNDYIAYMRFVSASISLRHWIERIFNISAQIDPTTYNKVENFDVKIFSSLIENLPADLKYEGTINTAGWIKVILSINYTNTAHTCDTLFATVLNAIVQSSLKI